MNADEINDVNEDYDILIVGGGPAGLSTWMHLNKYAPDLAEKTLLIEKETYPRDKVCGGGLGGWSGMVLKQLRITLDVPHLPISDVEFIYGDNHFMLHQPNQFIMIQRRGFDHLLAKTAIKRGLNLCQGVQFLDLSRKNDGLVVKTSKGNYKVKVLIAADGSLSKIRHKLRITNAKFFAPTLETFTPVNPDFDEEINQKKITLDLSEIDNGLQGYIWHCPAIGNDSHKMCHGLADFRIYPDKEKVDMKAILKGILKKRNKEINLNSWVSHPIRWYAPSEIVSQPNILFVGDAAGIEPLIGGGIHFALSYGGLASKAIVDAFDTNDFTFSNYGGMIQSHLIGKWIAKCTTIAKGIYGGSLNPLEGAKEVFTIKPDELRNMIQ